MVCSSTVVPGPLWIFFITDCHFLTFVMGNFILHCFLCCWNIEVNIKMSMVLPIEETPVMWTSASLNCYYRDPHSMAFCISELLLQRLFLLSWTESLCDSLLCVSLPGHSAPVTQSNTSLGTAVMLPRMPWTPGLLSIT